VPHYTLVKALSWTSNTTNLCIWVLQLIPCECFVFQMKASKTVIVIIFVFLVCWIPNEISASVFILQDLFPSLPSTVWLLLCLQHGCNFFSDFGWHVHLSSRKMWKNTILTYESHKTLLTFYLKYKVSGYLLWTFVVSEVSIFGTNITLLYILNWW